MNLSADFIFPRLFLRTGLLRKISPNAERGRVEWLASSSNLFSHLSSISKGHITYYNSKFLSGVMKQGRAFHSSRKNSSKSSPGSSTLDGGQGNNELKVAVCYDNAGLSKSQIISENRGRAGVYR